MIQNWGVPGTGAVDSVYWCNPQDVLPAPSANFFKVWPRPTVGATGNDAFTLDRRPSKAIYPPNGRVYYVGGHTQNMMFSEARQFLPQHILPPTLAWSMAASAGPGVTGTAIPHIAFWDQTHRRRSPLSAAGTAVVLTDQSRTWTLPVTGFPSEFVSHIELWVSMDGLTPRLVARVDRGVATYTEAVPTLSLGEAFADTFTHFPVCTINEVWNFRQVLAGDVQHPDRIYLSLLGEPEKWGGFFLRTLDGFPVTGMVAVRDVLIVASAQSTMRITGFTEDDITIEYLEPGIGCISHHLIGRFHDYAIIPNVQRPYLCTGSSMHPLGTAFAETWRAAYRQNRVAWETRGWTMNDPEEEVILINVNSLITADDGEKFSDGQKGRWVLDYATVVPETGGGFGQPDLTIDVEARDVQCAGVLYGSDAQRGAVYLGGDDGFVRRYNANANVNDDSDTYGKKLVIRTGHDYLGEDGGDEWDGHKLLALWSHILSEAAGYTLNVYAGDDEAFRSNPPQHTEVVPAGATTDPYTGSPLVPKTLHYSEPMVAGRGFTSEWVQSNGILKWAGYGGTVEPGQANRGIVNP